MQTFYWHDYETFGTDTRRDRPVQFAGIRTDTDFNIIEKPLVVYCRPAPDYLPDPEACLVTGITPQQAAEKGFCEAEFIHCIHQQLAQPSTCTVGYNNIRFDDEVTRNTLYRNFYDPYAREWQNGNSRWDLIDLVRLTRALRPKGINWPNHEDGKPSFRLEDLTASNGIEHSSAHDALADVYATIALAQLIKQAQAKLFQFIFQHRSKASLLELLKLGSMQPLIHVSGMYSSEMGCIAVVLPLCKDPNNSNGVVVYNLSTDPESMLELPAEDIHQRLFTATQNLPAGVARIPLKTIHINKCPVVVPINVLRSEDAERLNINLPQCIVHLEKIKNSNRLNEKLTQVFSMSQYETQTDPDLMIYSGGFFSESDKSQMQVIRNTPAEKLSSLNLNFKDGRLNEMLFRYRARNYPHTLDQSEHEKWRDFCISRLTGKQDFGSITFTDYFDKLGHIKQQSGTDPKLVSSLGDYANQLKQKLLIT